MPWETWPGRPGNASVSTNKHTDDRGNQIELQRLSRTDFYNIERSPLTKATKSLVSNTQKAMKLGIKIILFTIDKESKIGNMASKSVEITAPSPKLKTGKYTHTSFQPMGSLFEQSLLITLETIIVTRTV